jgi:hypothetical protein
MSAAPKIARETSINIAKLQFESALQEPLGRDWRAGFRNFGLCTEMFF